MQRNILRGSLLLLTAVTGWAQTQPATPAAPERIEERHYVRKFSFGITGSLMVLNGIAKDTSVLKVPSNPPVEFDTKVDPAGGRAGFGFTAQYTVTKRWAVAISPSYRKIKFTGFTQRYDGVDNTSTLIDERALTTINEETSARYLDIPILLRRYSKDHTESGKRFFFDLGATYRKVSSVHSSQKIDPPNADPHYEYVPQEHKSGVLGAVFGVGGQFIDDFGIRAIPEVRYTYWTSKPFNSIHGHSRQHQIEVLITLAF